MSVHDGSAARAFSVLTGRIHSWLPGILGKLIPQTFVGFALINSTTFTLDMILLWLTRGVLGLPYPVSVTVSFGTAATLAFFLNKILNFRARGDIGKQSSKYVLVLISNYVFWILGFSSLLVWLGVNFLVARVLAGIAEGIYIYLCSRLWVFRKRGSRRVTPPTPHSA